MTDKWIGHHIMLTDKDGIYDDDGVKYLDLVSMGSALDESLHPVLYERYIEYLELLENGEFDDDLSSWILGDAYGGGYEWSDGEMKCTTSGVSRDHCQVYQTISTTVGVDYTISGEITKGATYDVFYAIRKGDDAKADVNGELAAESQGAFSYTFTATATLTYIIAQVNSSFSGLSDYITIDNISVLPSTKTLPTMTSPNSLVEYKIVADLTE